MVRPGIESVSTPRLQQGPSIRPALGRFSCGLHVDCLGNRAFGVGASRDQSPSTRPTLPSTQGSGVTPARLKPSVRFSIPTQASDTALNYPHNSCNRETGLSALRRNARVAIDRWTCLSYLHIQRTTRGQCTCGVFPQVRS